MGGAIYIPPKRVVPPEPIEPISLIPEKIIEYEFNQKILLSNFELISNETDKESKTVNQIIFTNPNYTSIDLDTYFLESEKIMKEKNLPSLPQEEINQRKESYDDTDKDENDLIDELFDEIEKDKENEEKKKEEKKEEEKKEEEKKEEEKKEEEKKEEEKKEEGKKDEEKKDEEKKENEKI